MVVSEWLRFGLATVSCRSPRLGYGAFGGERLHAVESADARPKRLGTELSALPFSADRYVVTDPDAMMLSDGLR